jgi:hypothetical protein
VREKGAPLKFNVFIDDSGSGGPIFDLNGNRIDQSKSPSVINMAGVFIKQEDQFALEQDWLRLRAQIAYELDVPVYPPIHARVMFGENERLATEIWGSPNPYLKVDREKRIEWLTLANKIVSRYSQQHKIFVTEYSIVKEEYANSISPYYESDLFQNEYAFLRSKSLKLTKKFHNVICNPHISVFTRLLLLINRHGKRLDASKIDLIYDCSPLNKGFDVLSTIAVIQKTWHMDLISNLSESSDRETQMLQVADICANRRHKIMVNHARGTPDPIVEDWCNRFPILSPRRDADRFTSQQEEHIATVVYEVARRAVEATDPLFTENYLVPLSDFVERIRSAKRDGSTGISILK